MHDSELVLKHSVSETSSLGERLRRSREARGLSQQEIARVLCLNVEIINALEQDTYHQKAEPVFVQGYLRNYANYLHLPLDGFFPSQDNINCAANGKVVNQQNKFLNIINFIGHVVIRFLNYAVFIILAVLIFIWWHDRHNAEEKSFTPIKMETTH
jgi:cytoskeletal protein RodZ